MSTRTRWIEVSCVEIDGKVVVLFYDLVRGVLIDDLTDYTVALSEDEQLDHKTVSNLSYDLRRFWEFLAAKGRSFEDCTDEDISKFRDEEFLAVMSSTKSRQNKRIAQGTVNARLRWVYRLLAWLQAQGRVPEGSIGERGCRVRSSLVHHEKIFDGVQRNRQMVRSSIGQQRRYPMTFRNVGSKSKHVTKFFPSDEVRYAAISSMHDGAGSDYIAHRNALFIDIANTVGWRRSSINSITIKEISEASSRMNDCDFVTLSPSVQKFGYTEVFDVPYWLVERIGLFIRDYLIPMSKLRRWKINVESSNVFLGVNGKPLKDRSITQIVSKAMRSVGAPAWASVHSFRRKFANDEISDETNYRLAKGLDTSAASISASVSLRLGQHDPDSIYPYVSRNMTVERASVDEKRRAHVDALEQENIRLKARLKDKAIRRSVSKD